MHRYSPSTKLAAIADYRAGKSVKQIASEIGAPTRTVRNWINGRGVRRIGKYNNRVMSAPPPARHVLLYAKRVGCYATAARIAGISAKQVHEWSYRWE